MEKTGGKLFQPLPPDRLTARLARHPGKPGDPLEGYFSMRILALSDLHYSNLSRNQLRNYNPHGALAATLLKKAFLRLEHLGRQPDLVVITGDLLQGDTSPQAELDLITLKGVLTRSGIPCLTLPGNHDLNSDTFNRIMGTRPGLHRIGGYGFIVFNDTFEEHPDYHSCLRPAASLAQTAQIMQAEPGLPLIALQHAPVYPAIDSDYPYNPLNAAQIIESYADSTLFLSLSGHYHRGTAPQRHRGVLYHTLPALTNTPFLFSLIELNGTEVEIETLSLRMEEDFITDVHCHTEHAYCGTTTDTAKCIALSRALGVGQLCITEHAFQLYFPKSIAMSFAWQSRPEMAAEVWNTPERSRMQGYREFVAAFRSAYVRAGMEVDLYNGGELLLAPQDLEFDWDVIVGAVHFIEGYARKSMPPQEAERLFMRDVERLLRHGVHVLAHPFRFFGRNRLETPCHLYQPVAELLAHYTVAAEINYHTHSPDPAFIKICAAKGVQLALGSDTHELGEAGEFYPHIALMKRAGIRTEEIKNHLFQL